jgi:hypothetical protein
MILLFVSTKLTAQDSILSENSSSAVQQQLEAIAENSETEENDYTNYLEVLHYRASHPLNLNKATVDQLQQLGLLNDIQINNLLEHIHKYGVLVSIYELQIINGFTMECIQKLLPYVYVSYDESSPPVSLKKIITKGQHMYSFRYGRVIEQQKGFTNIDSASLIKSPNSRYIGSPDKLYTRYNYTYNDKISWGITAEKDQGELFLKKNQRFSYPWYNAKLNNNQQNGFDFYSAHIYLQNMRFIKTLAMGDYQATFGQGLTLWNGYALNKSYNTISGKRTASGIRPYKSVNENNFFRGIATTLSHKHTSFSVFISHKKVDGNISDTLPDGTITISSLQQTGYHSTPSEIYDKRSVTQTIAGGNMTYKTNRLSLGATALNYQLHNRFIADKKVYNKFDFSSNQNFNAGIDYNYVFKNFNFFGEQAISQNGAMAFVNGLLVSLDERIQLSLIHRNYQRNYQNSLSNAFRQNTQAQNEKGLYTGISVSLSPKIMFYCYFDRFEFPWLKYNVDAPSKGYEFLIQTDFIPSKKLSAYIRYKKSNTMENSINDDESMNYIIAAIRHNYRFNISYSIMPSVKLKNRIEYVSYQTDESKSTQGYMMYQDIHFHKPTKPLSLILRYALFQTDNYDTRIYAYENDVAGYYSIPSYAYRGTRFYIIVNYALNRHIELWLRYSQTFYDDRNIISEGSLNQIEGNQKSEVRAQITCKF